MRTFALRISCPDRPGRLGAVATALGRWEVNIVALDVVERDRGVAVDHLIVESGPLSLDDLISAVESVPGVVVEIVHTVVGSGRRGPLQLVADTVTGSEDVFGAVIDGVPEAFDATWCVALRPREPQLETLSASADAPSLVRARAPWLPVDEARILQPGPWVPAHWDLDPVSASLAVVPLGGDGDALFAARARGPVFRRRELADLAHVGRIAGRLRVGAAAGR